jgi:hypothetical protein
VCTCCIVCLRIVTTYQPTSVLLGWGQRLNLMRWPAKTMRPSACKRASNLFLHLDNLLTHFCLHACMRICASTPHKLQVCTWSISINLWASHRGPTLSRNRLRPLINPLLACFCIASCLFVCLVCVCVCVVLHCVEASCMYLMNPLLLCTCAAFVLAQPVAQTYPPTPVL